MLLTYWSTRVIVGTELRKSTMERPTNLSAEDLELVESLGDDPEDWNPDEAGDELEALFSLADRIMAKGFYND